MKTRRTPLANKLSRKRGTPFRPCFEHLEDRRLLATFTEFGSLLDIDLDVANEKLTVTTHPDGYLLSLANSVLTGTNGQFSSGSGSSELAVMANDISQVLTTLISIRDSATGASVEFADSTSNTKYVASIDVRLEHTGASEVVFKGTTEFLASAGIDIETTRNVRFASGSSLSTVDGNVVVTANMGSTMTSMNLPGLWLDNSQIQTTGSGNIDVTARGGNQADQWGILVGNNSTMRAIANGAITLKGNGADSSFRAMGIGIAGSSRVSTTNGDLSIIGTGSGQGASNWGVAISSGGRVETTGSGDILIEGSGGQSTGIGNDGVFITHSNTIVSTASGNIDIQGHAGGIGDSRNNSGVIIHSSGDQSGAAVVQAGGSGNLTIDGRGNTLAEGDHNVGVVVGDGASASVDSGNLPITGQGGGSGASGYNSGVYVDRAGVITSIGSGNVNVIGTGGNGSGDNNPGVIIHTAATVSTGSGELEVTGVGGGSGASEANNGIQIGGAIVSTTSGPLRLSGTGGLTSGKWNQGVGIWNGATVTSATGDVSVDGTGGGTGPSFQNYGVQITTNTVVGTTATGNVSIIGQGGASDGNSNNGVAIAAPVETSAGNISIQGTGGGGIGNWNRGVGIWNGGTVITGSGELEVTGIGGGSVASEGNYGIQIQDAVVSSTSGPLRLSGIGGTGTGGGNTGITVFNTGVISSGNGNLTLSGRAGESGGMYNHGIHTSGANIRILTVDGDLTAVGYGGGSGLDSDDNHGFLMDNQSRIASTGLGNISLESHGGTSLGGYNVGLVIRTDASVTSNEGSIDITSFAGTGTSGHGIAIAESTGGLIASTAGDINILTDAFAITPAGSITSGNNSSISIAPLTKHSRVLLGDDISLHGAWLQLSDSELDQFNTPNLTIGNSRSGEIIVTNNIIREQAANVSLISAELIVTAGGSIDTGGGTLSLSSGNYGSLDPLSSGTDFTASTTTFGSDSRYQATINGTTVDTLFSQANIIGGVNLNSSQFEVIGGFIPQTGGCFHGH